MRGPACRPFGCTLARRWYAGRGRDLGGGKDRWDVISNEQGGLLAALLGAGERARRALSGSWLGA